MPSLINSSLEFTQAEILAILSARYPVALLDCPDASYNVPSSGSMDRYLQELADWLKSAYGDQWADYHDCDNFALTALELANRKHYLARKAGRGSAQGIAIFMINFRPGAAGTGYHRVNLWIDSVGRIHEFEPQNRLPLVLDLTQCLSVSRVLAA
jgi:hypothetical protein